MNQELFNFSEYSVFVWPAFIFTFFCFFTLYQKTKKEFLRQEKIFLREFGKISLINVTDIKQNKIEEKIFSNYSKF